MENVSMRILSELQTEFATGTSNDFVFLTSTLPE